MKIIVVSPYKETREKLKTLLKDKAHVVPQDADEVRAVIDEDPRQSVCIMEISGTGEKDPDNEEYNGIVHEIETDGCLSNKKFGSKNNNLRMYRVLKNRTIETDEELKDICRGIEVTHMLQDATKYAARIAAAAGDIETREIEGIEDYKLCVQKEDGEYSHEYESLDIFAYTALSDDEGFSMLMRKFIEYTNWEKLEEAMKHALAKAAVRTAAKNSPQ